jgi:ankyrin repeat protein
MLLNSSHANQFIKNRDGDLPVHLACQKSQHDLIALLAENCSGALAVFDENGWLPLHLACIENAPLETVYTLLRHDPHGTLLVYLRDGSKADSQDIPKSRCGRLIALATAFWTDNFGFGIRRKVGRERNANVRIGD